MKKEIAKKKLIAWLDNANIHRKQIEAGVFLPDQTEWFAMAVQMQEAYLSLLDNSTGEEMPEDVPFHYYGD
jgi:hypothetical protein